MNLEDRVAVVTGSARGIGKAIARHLLDAGASVGIVDLDLAEVEAACRDLAAACPQNADRRIAGFTCDVSVPDAVDTLFRSVQQRFGKLDILVNNAGITRDSVFGRMTFEQKYDHNTAILAGDSLLSIAYEFLLKDCNSNAKRSNKCIYSWLN